MASTKPTPWTIALVVVGASIVIGWVAVSGVAAASSGDILIDTDFEADGPGNWQTFQNAVSGSMVGGDPVQSLRLTDAKTGSTGTAIYEKNVSASEGLTVKFRYYQDAGGNDTGHDGFSFFLMDGSALPAAVDLDDLARGDTRNVGYDGITGGFLGFEFAGDGDFDGGTNSAASEVANNSTASERQTLRIKGPTEAGNPVLFSKTYDSAGAVNGGWRQAEITLSPVSGRDNTVTISLAVDIDQDGNLETIVADNEYELPEHVMENGELPPFRAGFSGSTERAAKIHAIDQVVVQSHTATAPSPTGGTPTLTTSPITDANTGDGNEVTLTVTFDEVMTEQSEPVSIIPDVFGNLTTTPTVETKRWRDARTLEATIQFADDNETASGVRLAVAGPTDVAGNEMNRSSMTYDVTTTNPRVNATEVTGPRNVTVTFSEGVYANDTSTGNLTIADFGYSDNSADGSAAIGSVSHTAGESKAVLTLDSAIHNSDLGTDTITIPPSTIENAAGNPLAATAHTYTDGAGDDVKPRVTSFTSAESHAAIAISFTVDEQLSSANLAIDGKSMYFYEDVNETPNDNGSYTYSVTHNPSETTGSNDGRYTVSLISISDGTNAVTSFDPKPTSEVLLDTRGPQFGSLVLPGTPIHTATPTIKIDGVRDRFNDVDADSIKIWASATDGSGAVSFSRQTTRGLHYADNTISLNLSEAGTRLRSETTYTITVSAQDDDVPANTNSKTFQSAVRIGTTYPTVANLSLSTNPITRAQTGEGNEVTLTARFNEAMNENATIVRVRPDVNGELKTQPTVTNKRWDDSRTFRAAIRFADGNENVSAVRLEVGGATDLDGNVMEPAATTYAVETVRGGPYDGDEEITDLLWLLAVLFAYYSILEVWTDY